MICTECYRDDGIEAPYFGFGKPRLELAAEVAQQWKCPDCLNISEAQLREVISHLSDDHQGTEP